ncbi:MAG: hypothetical protein KF855_10850 [Acidobacteria bacterium]|nr:hypothetical protein [Acidobacteriota bacterium]
MVDDNLIATLEQSLRQTRNAQNRLTARLRDVEGEAQQLREEIAALDNSSQQTELAIDSLLANLRSGSRSRTAGSNIRFDDKDRELEPTQRHPVAPVDPRPRDHSPAEHDRPRNTGSVAYINQPRGVPMRFSNTEALSNRFADRTITQACTLLLREAGRPLHVNELYNLLVEGGMTFKGNNPTISIAVSLNRNRRFRKVEPGTFDLVMREAIQAAS